VLASKAVYRNRQCYRLIVQICVSQALKYPGYVLLGISRYFSFDPWDQTLNLLTATSRVEVFLSFVLALNRLKIMASLKYPEAVDTQHKKCPPE
uniref:G protein-coupled receptor n=1 Tax=Steinernema glaseri TaxID=37863 RepID=A0A1I8ALZ7_9BILA